MRLICPNCDAQYEVPADVMPLEGREVQCSNCGYTWFQNHPDAPQTDDALQYAEEDAAAAQPAGAGASSEETAETMASPAEEKDNPTDDAATPEDEDAASVPEEQAATAPVPPRRALDPTVADVLRAEAELEEQARRKELTGVESQPELGLAETPSPEAKFHPQQAQTSVARTQGEAGNNAERQPSDTPVAAASAASRRDLLPDIEEINSTLRSNSDRSPATDPGQTAQMEAREQRKSRRGFALTVMLVAIGVLIYAFAPDIGEAIPQMQQPLTTYVTTIDAARDWLDGQVIRLLGWLDQTAQSTSGE